MVGNVNLFITGLSGFVGAALAREALSRGIKVSGQVRSRSIATVPAYKLDLLPDTDWREVLDGVDCVVHCAARVHQMEETESDALAAYRRVNTDGTLNLAKQAVQCGVKRFVFLSTIKVNGESTQPGLPFLPNIGQAPVEPYGQSKYEAEIGLNKLAEETGLEVVIIRPPLVYGPGVKANFLSMMRWIDRGILLPLGAIHNQRSLVYVENLVDLILTCCDHPEAKGHTFLVSDGEEISTSVLLHQVAIAMNKPDRMLPVPASWLKIAARVVGKADIGRRLCGNLQVDISHTTHTLGWKPPYSFEEGIKCTVDAYMKCKAKAKGD